MKTQYVFSVVVALCAAGLTAFGQDSNQVTAGVTPALAPVPTNQPAPPPAPEPLPPPLPEGRSVSYAPLVGGEPINTNMPVVDEEAEVVGFDETPLTDAVRALALQAGLNIQFDPALLGVSNGVPLVTIKWHKITPMQAIHALLDNSGWDLVWDYGTKVGRVTKKNPAAHEPLIITVIYLSYGNPTNIVREVEGTLSAGSAVIPDVRTHSLILRTTEKERPGVEALIKKLDTATREVLVEAKIIETSKDVTSAKGVDWTGTLQAQHISFGNGLTQGTQATSGTTVSGNGLSASTVSPGGSSITGGGAGNSPLGTITSNITSITTTLSGNTQQGGGFSLNTARGISPATAFLNADGVQAVLSFLNTDNDSKTIAFPRTVALDGVPTTLAVVQNIPIFQQTQSAPAGGSASGLATILPVYDLKVGTTILNEVGVKLTVTPRIAAPSTVLMKLKPEISQQLPGLVSETLDGQVNQAPSFARSQLETEASVPSGYTLVLGGMDQDIVNKTFNKVPFFGDLPGLGSVFRSDSKSHSKETILIFVTPTIIGEADYQPTDTGFLRRKPLVPDEKEESAWNSGEPYDWTKPQNNPFSTNFSPYH